MPIAKRCHCGVTGMPELESRAYLFSTSIITAAQGHQDIFKG
jgi:hypothetical protein